LHFGSWRTVRRVLHARLLVPLCFRRDSASSDLMSAVGLRRARIADRCADEAQHLDLLRSDKEVVSREHVAAEGEPGVMGPLLQLLLRYGLVLASAERSYGAVHGRARSGRVRFNQLEIGAKYRQQARHNGVILQNLQRRSVEFAQLLEKRLARQPMELLLVAREMRGPCP